MLCSGPPGAGEHSIICYVLTGYLPEHSIICYAPTGYLPEHSIICYVLTGYLSEHSIICYVPETCIFEHLSPSAGLARLFARGAAHPDTRADEPGEAVGAGVVCTMHCGFKANAAPQRSTAPMKACGCRSIPVEDIPHIAVVGLLVGLAVVGLGPPLFVASFFVEVADEAA